MHACAHGLRDIYTLVFICCHYSLVSFPVLYPFPSGSVEFHDSLLTTIYPYLVGVLLTTTLVTRSSSQYLLEIWYIYYPSVMSSNNSRTNSPQPPALVPSTASSSVSVIVKIPPFWPADPELWFAQVDAQFTTKGITAQRTKFDHVIASLSPEFASEQKRLQQLFNTEELGDRTPSQLVRCMNQLLGDKAATADRSFLRELFLQRLPLNVRMVLAAATKESDDLETIAALADKISEVATPAVTSVEIPQLSSEVEQLRTQISDLQTLVRSFQRTPRSRSKSKSRDSRQRSASPAPASSLCWYHNRFGEKASKCVPPCNWNSGNDTAGR